VGRGRKNSFTSRYRRPKLSHVAKINSKRKGAAGELELASLFRKLGFEGARRTEQYCGKGGTSDVLIPNLPHVHIECKRTKVFKGYEWLEQAEKDSGGLAVPLVFWKKDRKDWVVLMDAEKFINLLLIPLAEDS